MTYLVFIEYLGGIPIADIMRKHQVNRGACHQRLIRARRFVKKYLELDKTVNVEDFRSGLNLTRKDITDIVNHFGRIHDFKNE
jgi:hypothetical protein